MAEVVNIKKNKPSQKEQYLGMLQPIGNYKDQFAAACEAADPRISTGMLDLDIALNGGFENELYIMAAESSTGKSAFSMFMAQNVAKQGIDVLYFALEMSRKELVARGTSMISFEHKREQEAPTAYTAANIMNWTYDKSVGFTKLSYSNYAAFAEEYFNRYGKHLYIIEGGIGGLSVKDIANIAALHKEQTGDPLVVFIDYLQLIKPDPEDRAQTDRKTKTDIVTLTLKTLASQIGMPVFALSSISRTQYGKSVSMGSSKESGDTEYTCGVAIGWNWAGVTDTKVEDKIRVEKKRCKDRGYRRMEFSILKYRNSERDKVIRLRYYPAYNFMEIEKDDEPKTRVIRG